MQLRVLGPVNAAVHVVDGVEPVVAREEVDDWPDKVPRAIHLR